MFKILIILSEAGLESHAFLQGTCWPGRSSWLLVLRGDYSLTPWAGSFFLLALCEVSLFLLHPASPRGTSQSTETPFLKLLLTFCWVCFLSYWHDFAEGNLELHCPLQETWDLSNLTPCISPFLLLLLLLPPPTTFSLPSSFLESFEMYLFKPLPPPSLCPPLLTFPSPLQSSAFYSPWNCSCP